MKESNVISLADSRPHLAGPCRCLECKHEWVGVAEVGTVAIECPSCGALKGGRFAMVIPETPTWECNCGNIFLVVTPDYTICPNCGERQVFP